MEVKKMVKRMAAIGASSVMVGATLMGAMAADLKDYPSMFVTNGAFNGVFIVGDNANAADTLATIDISNNMWYNKASTSTATTAIGDAWKVATSAKFLEMTNSNSSYSTVSGESFSAITSYIGSSELKALAAGKFSTGESEYPYNQYLYFSDVSSPAQTGIVKYAMDDDDKTADFLYFKNGNVMFRYKLEFTSQASSDIVDSTGAASTTGTILQDYENKKITMFGKEYTIVLARRHSSGRTASVRLMMMGGAESSTILESEEKTIAVKGKDYKVKLNYVDGTYAKFDVNGELTDKLQVGDTKKLKDGTEIGVSEVLYQSYAGGVHSATFFLGADKLELKDELITDALSDTELILGTESVDGANVVITGTDNNVTTKLSTIEVNSTAQDDYFVPANGKLSTVITAAGEHVGSIFTNNWDIEYQGMTKEDSHDVKVDTSGDRNYNVIWYDGDNKKVTMPVAYSDAIYNLSMGDEAAAAKELVLLENSAGSSFHNLSKNDFFVVTGGTSSNDAVTTVAGTKSYLLQYKGADAVTKTSPKIKFKVTAEGGDTLEYALETGTTVTKATIKLGGYSFIVRNLTTMASDDAEIDVDMNGDGDVTETTPIAIKDYYGARIQVASYLNDTWANVTQPDQINVTVDWPDGNDWDTESPTPLIWVITSATGPKVSGTIAGAFSQVQPSGETSIGYGYTTMGGKITYNQPTSSPYAVTISTPKKQQLPQVFVTAKGSEFSTTAGGESTLVSIPVTASKLASEVADVKAQNAIVVGGPCANAAAATLLGNPADCAEGFTPGKAKIKLFENGDKVALLVAGYAADDTRAAGKALAAYKVNKFTGKEAEIERTGSVSEYKVVAATAAVVATTTP